ncbi:MAG: hypothetical protein AAB756_01070 [Patescibacteria group bacterium]
MPRGNTVVPVRLPNSKNDAAEAELLVAKILFRISRFYGKEDKFMLFRVLAEPPAHGVLILVREILTKDYGYEDVEWYYDEFMWNIIICREKILLL